VITLEVADLVVIAGRMLGLDTAGVLDLLDPVAAERALAQVRPEADPGDLACPAAVLLCALLREQPLRRGNQQVALAAVLQFLALNGQQMDPGPAEAVVAVVTGTANGTLGATQVADWLASRLRAADGPAVGAKEEPMRARPALPLAGRIRKATARRKPAGRGLFRRFSDQAMLAVHLAIEEARGLRHAHVGTEHLLLGLVFNDEGLAAKALESLGLSLAEVRHQVVSITGHGQHIPPDHAPFTPQVKRALELSLREALSLGHNYVGPEHVLLGLLREKRGIGARVLTGLGVDYDQVRARIADLTDRREQADREAQRTGQATPAGLADTVRQLDQVRTGKEAALDAEDFEAARALRDREKELLAAKARLERQLEALPDPPDILQAVLVENHQLSREVDRLRGLLRDHGIEPDGGTARPA
jgi:prophage maintenance system killer protein